jgi:acetyltransferase-like isoleucine patch superfamily enzyme
MYQRLFNQYKKLSYLWHRYHLSQIGVEIHASCLVERQVRANLGTTNGKPGQIQLAAQVQLEPGAVLYAWGGHIAIAENVFIGPYTVIYGHGGVEIGKDSLIAMHCRILSANHTIPDYEHRIRDEPNICRSTKIGEDVWLGAGVTVLGGVTIGDGCVVGAGSVVTKDLPPYAIAVGVPAKVVRTRI